MERNTAAALRMPAGNHRTRRSPLTVTILLASGAVTVLVILYGPEYLWKAYPLLFDLPPRPVTGWVATGLFVYFCIFTAGTVFPFCLHIGFMMLSPPPKRSDGTAPFVSVIIPSFNEERCIRRSLHAALSLDYPNYEVIIVDDGSTDLTLPIIENTEVSCIRLRRNKGKAEALNAGLAHAKGEIVVFSDSDSWMDPGAVRYLVRHFTDPRVGAVAGTVIVDGPASFLRRWQSIEYRFGQSIVKTAQMGGGGCVTICPGPASAYRKEVLEAVGGFTGRTLAEDFDASLQVIGMGYRLSYEPRAVAYTEAPDSWKSLGRQRLRWSRGNLQVFMRNRSLVFSRTGGMVSWFWLPFYMILLGYGGVLAETAALFLIPAVAAAYGSVAVMVKAGLIYLVLANSIGFSQILLALARTGRFTPSFILAALLMYPYNFFLNWIKLIALTQEIRRKKATWFK